MKASTRQLSAVPEHLKSMKIELKSLNILEEDEIKQIYRDRSCGGRSRRSTG
jgi:hypothetical protein